MTTRLDSGDLDALAKGFREDGFCILRNVFARETVDAWSAAFLPLLTRHIAAEDGRLIRGPGRHYVTLPFLAPFADPSVFENDNVLALVTRLVGDDAVLCQLATDTPVDGSDFQDVHRDAKPLFPEAGIETPAFQLALNFPLVDVDENNGPMEIARGTHVVSRDEGLRLLASGQTRLEPIFLSRGDALLRDVRGLHRGTPNPSSIPRPMVVLGYSRGWLLRPEVEIRVPRATWAGLSERARKLLRHNPIVDDAAALPPKESYSEFAY